MNKEIFGEIKKAYRRPYGFLTWSLTIILSLLVLFILVREPVFRFFLEKKITTFNQEHNSEFAYQKITFKGFSSVLLHGVSLKEKNSDTLLKIKKVEVSVSFWKLFLKRLSIQKVYIDNLDITMYKRGKSDNYMFLLKNAKSEDENEENQQRSISNRVKKVMNLLFDIVPESLNFNNLKISYTKDSHRIAFTIPEVELIRSRFKCNINTIEDNDSSNWVAEGLLNKSEEELSLKIFSLNSDKVKMPWLAYRNNAMINFDTLFLNMRHSEGENATEVISGLVTVDNLALYHKKIASDTVEIGKISNNYRLNCDENSIEYDSSSTVIINQLELHPYLRYQPKPSKCITMSLNKPWFNASTLFSSLPKGLFNNFEGIEVSGELSYHGFLNIDLSLPDSMKIESDLTQKNFKITKPGSTNFAKINSTFEHKIYEKEKEVRTMVVGPENPNFVPFERIPVSLKNAILMSEDGWFFEHGGFSLGAFRESIITNIKTKKFTRGGSTISMQLVKNLFLNRKKNIGRKVEELLIVWLLERQRMSTKERMFEIYVNIIEWGPNIYGASEAAHFYFNKEVTALTLDECIYLAAIIPSPKHFKYLFNEDGTFKEYILNYYEFVLKRMVKHERITQAESDAVKPYVSITGPAKELFQSSKDTLSPVSIEALR